MHSRQDFIVVRHLILLGKAFSQKAWFQISVYINNAKWLTIGKILWKQILNYHYSILILLWNFNNFWVDLGVDKERAKCWAEVWWVAFGRLCEPAVILLWLGASCREGKCYWFCWGFSRKRVSVGVMTLPVPHFPAWWRQPTIMDYQGTIADDMLIILISGVLHISHFHSYGALEPHTVYFPITETCLSRAHWFLLNIKSGRRSVLPLAFVVVHFYFVP